MSVQTETVDMRDNQSESQSTPTSHECLIVLNEYVDKPVDGNLVEQGTKYYFENINSMCRIPMKDLLQTIQLLPLELLKSIRNKISNNFLLHFRSIHPANLVLKSKSSSRGLSQDIFRLSHLLCNKIYDNDHILEIYKYKTNKDTNCIEKDDLEDIYTVVEDNAIELKKQNQLLNEIIKHNKQLQSIISHQSNLIDKLIIENNTLKTTVDNNTSTITRINLAMSKLSTSNFQNSHQTASAQSNQTYGAFNPQPFHPPIPSYSQTVQTNIPLCQETPRPNKRQLQNENNSQKSKQSKSDNTESGNNQNLQNLNRPKPQQSKKTLKSFDSSNPELPNKDLDEKKDDGFKVAGPKKPKQKKSSTESYLKNSGKGQNIGFEACERKMEIYLGRVGLKVDNKSVEDYVKNIVNIFKFEELTLVHKNFKSFKFEISIFDRDKINDKSLWPRGTVVNRYHRPYIQKTQQDINNQMDFAPQTSSSSQ